MSKSEPNLGFSPEFFAILRKLYFLVQIINSSDRKDTSLLRLQIFRNMEKYFENDLATVKRTVFDDNLGEGFDSLNIKDISSDVNKIIGQFEDGSPEKKILKNFNVIFDNFKLNFPGSDTVFRRNVKKKKGVGARFMAALRMMRRRMKSKKSKNYVPLTQLNNLGNLYSDAQLNEYNKVTSISNLTIQNVQYELRDVLMRLDPEVINDIFVRNFPHMKQDLSMEDKVGVISDQRFGVVVIGRGSDQSFDDNLVDDIVKFLGRESVTSGLSLIVGYGQKVQGRAGGDSHWICIDLKRDLENPHLIHVGCFDSLGAPHKEVPQSLVRVLKKLKSSEFIDSLVSGQVITDLNPDMRSRAVESLLNVEFSQAEVIDCIQQNNAHDCGLHASFNAVCYGLGFSEPNEVGSIVIGGSQVGVKEFVKDERDRLAAVFVGGSGQADQDQTRNKTKIKGPKKGGGRQKTDYRGFDADPEKYVKPSEYRRTMSSIDFYAGITPF